MRYLHTCQGVLVSRDNDEVSEAHKKSLAPVLVEFRIEWRFTVGDCVLAEGL